MYGLRYNIAVGILFIEAWLSGGKFSTYGSSKWQFNAQNLVFMDVYDVLGKGHFFYLGKVEDSATAEISRSQVGFQKLSNVHSTIYTNGQSKSMHLSGVAVDPASGETGG